MYVCTQFVVGFRGREYNFGIRNKKKCGNELPHTKKKNGRNNKIIRWLICCVKTKKKPKKKQTEKLHNEARKKGICVPVLFDDVWTKCTRALTNFPRCLSKLLDF